MEMKLGAQLYEHGTLAAGMVLLDPASREKSFSPPSFSLVCDSEIGFALWTSDVTEHGLVRSPAFHKGSDLHRHRSSSGQPGITSEVGSDDGEISIEAPPSTPKPGEGAELSVSVNSDLDKEVDFLTL